MNFIILTILIIACVFYYIRYDYNILNPKVLQMIPWIISIAILSIFKYRFNLVSNYTYIIILIGIIFFQMGCFVGQFNIYRFKDDINKNKSLILNIKTLNISIIISINILIIMTIKAINIANQVNISNFYTSLRIGLGPYINITGGYGKLSYFLPLCYAMTNFIIILYITQPNYRQKIKVQTIIMILLSIWITILTTGRGFILQLITIVFSSVYLYSAKKKSLNKYAWILVIIFIAIFCVYTIILRSNDIDSLNKKDSITFIINQISGYTSGSIPALDYFISNQKELDVGLNSFRTINAIFSTLGYDIQVIDLVKEFTPGKSSTNIYTVYEPYISDFGILGAFMYQFIFGFMHGYLYKKSKKNIMFMYFYVISIFPLLMQPLLDQYFSLLSTWIQYLIWGLLLYKSNLIIRHNKRGEEIWENTQLHLS